jgi:hypothetical protein
MSRKRRMVLIVIWGATLALYVSGYFMLPDYTASAPFGARYFKFPDHGLNRVYAPMGWLECKFSGRKVVLSGPDADPWSEDLVFEPGALW